jgi:DNA-binding XRE family transcriptional regulator
MEKNEDFVYVFYSRSLPHVVKIGYSGDCLERLKGINTGLPYSFKVMRKWKVSNAHKLEKEIHRQLDFCRVKSNREFFSLSPQKAIEAIGSIIEKGTYELFPKDEVGELAKVKDFGGLGKLIRHERRRQGLTQKDLAFTSGTGLRVIGDIERGKETAQVGIIFKVISLLRVNIYWENKI